jgi:hypothetical protein
MGEGKTSVILPMLSAALADGKQLVRIVVLKPLADEMLRLISQSLAGLVGRTVYFLPFSRQTSVDESTAQRLMELYTDCLNLEGVVVTLPEFLNSYRLITSDKLLPESRHIATDLSRVQKWLDRHSRDIIDEADAVLKPSYELVYTHGEAHLLSGAPDRWLVTLELLSLVPRCAITAHKQALRGIEYEGRTAVAYPHVRVLDQHGGDFLTKSLVRNVLAGKLPSMPLGHCDVEVLQAVEEFLSVVKIDPEKCRLIHAHFTDSTQLDNLYVLRGLILIRY